jgi:hypothetical protein
VASARHPSGKCGEDQRGADVAPVNKAERLGVGHEGARDNETRSSREHEGRRDWDDPTTIVKRPVDGAFLHHMLRQTCFAVARWSAGGLRRPIEEAERKESAPDMPGNRQSL